MRRAVAELGFDGVYDLIAVKRADVRAHSDALAQLPLEIFSEMESLLARIAQRGDCCSLKELAVSGRELTALGYKGRAVGDILERLLDLVLENPDLNQKAYLLQEIETGNLGADRPGTE